MLYFLVNGNVEPEVTLYARRRCKRGDCYLHREPKGRVAVGFRDEDRAALFMNLFEDEIERSYEGPAPQQVAA